MVAVSRLPMDVLRDPNTLPPGMTHQSFATLYAFEMDYFGQVVAASLNAALYPRTKRTDTYNTRIATRVARAAARDPERFPGALSGEP